MNREESIRTQHPSPVAGAFTLVELLVVFAIISVLAALLLPALAGGLERAKSIQCQSNERQISMALHTYTQDNNGFFPYAWDPYWPCSNPSTCFNTNNTARDWQSKMVPYLGPVPTQFPSPPNKWIMNPNMWCPKLDRSYSGLNGWLGCYSLNGGIAAQPVSIVSHQASCLLVIDGGQGRSIWVGETSNYGFPATWHGTMIIAAYVDGHASIVPTNAITNAAMSP